MMLAELIPFDNILWLCGIAWIKLLDIRRKLGVVVQW